MTPQPETAVAEPKPAATPHPGTEPTTPEPEIAAPKLDRADAVRISQRPQRRFGLTDRPHRIERREVRAEGTEQPDTTDKASAGAAQADDSTSGDVTPAERKAPRLKDFGKRIDRDRAHRSAGSDQPRNSVRSRDN